VDAFRKLNVPPALSGAPLIIPVLAFCLGIAVGRHNPPSAALMVAWIVVSILVFIVFRTRRVIRITSLCALAAGTGALHHAVMLRFLPADHITNFAATTPRRTTLTGVVLTAPVIPWPEKTFPYYAPPSICTYFDIKAERLRLGDREIDVCGLAQVAIPGVHDRYRPGMRLSLRGRLSARTPYARWPGVFASSRVAAHQPKRVQMRVASENYSQISPQSGSRVRAVLDRMRQVASAMLVPDGSQTGLETRSLLSAMILGRRYQIEDELKRAFITAGVWHFLAVSGFHVGVLATTVWLIAQALGLSRRSAGWLVLAAIWLFVAVNELRPPILRAAITGTFACLAILTRKPINSTNWLAAAGLIILLVNPDQLFSAGFQLSFVSVAGIILLRRPIYERLFGPSREHPRRPIDTESVVGRLAFFGYCVAEWAKFGVAISFAACGAVLPILMSHFGRVSIIGPLAAVAVYPFATIFIVLGFLTLLIRAALVGIPFVSIPTDILGPVLAKLVRLFAHLPGVSLSVMPPPAVLTTGYYAILLWVVLTDRSASAAVPRRGYGLGSQLRRLAVPTARKNCMMALIAVYLTYWIVAAGAVPTESRERTEVVAARRGGGQLVAVPAGRALVVIDCGVSRTDEAVALIEALQVKYLASPAAIFLTFPEQRFFNDLPSLRGNFPDIAVYASGGFIAAREFYEPVARLFEMGILTDRRVLGGGQVCELEDCDVKMLYPSSELVSTVVRWAEPLSKLTGSRMVRRLGPMGGVVLVRISTINIVVCCVLTPIACDLITGAYGQLRARVLIVGSRTTVGEALQRFMESIGVEHLVVCGRPWTGARRWYQKTCDDMSIKLTVVGSESWTVPIGE